MTISGGPLSVEIPSDWDKYSDSDLEGMWTAGALDDKDAMTTQVRIGSLSGQVDAADSANAYLTLGNQVFGGESPIENFKQQGQEKAEVEGGDRALITYFSFDDEDGDGWSGLYLSVDNKKTRKVSTLEIMSLDGEGISKEEALKIVDSARYDKSKE